MKVKRIKTISPKVISKVKELLTKENLSGFNASKDNGGKCVVSLERKFCGYFGVRHAISVNSWTSGLEIAIKSLQLDKGSEIICSPWSMSATVAAVVNAGMVPVFADIKNDTLNIDPVQISRKITAHTKAVLMTEMHGQSCDVDEILQIAHEHGLITISDTAQSIGSHYKGRFTGTLTDIGGFSFNWHKHLNCGEGGMVITNNDELADRMRKLRNHGETTGTEFGHNYRMTEINAVLVEQQLPALRKRINARIKIANTLRSLIKNKDVEMPLQLDDRNHVFCSIPLLFKNKKTRDGVFDKLRINYPVKTNFSAGPLHLLDACKSFKKSMPVTEKVPDRLLDIDMNYTYSDANLKEIAKIINRAG